MHITPATPEFLRKRLLKRIGVGIAVLLVVGGIGYLFYEPWETTAFSVDSVGGNSILVAIACTPDLRAEVVRETPEVIEIKAQKKNDNRGDCYGGVNVTTQEPVGERVIIDHSTGEPAPRWDLGEYG